MQRSRTLSAVYLFVCVALVLLPSVRSEYEWSGFVNALGERVDFLCPDNRVVVGLASDFSSVVLDRQWEFQCATGGGLANVSVTCSILAAVNSLRDDIDFNCPNDGYIGGFVSEFNSAQSDRVWQPYCCNRPYASLINCQIPTASWENILRENLNYSAPQGLVVAGIQSFYFNRDRRWRFRACEIEVNCGDPGVPDNAVREGDSFLYGDSVTFTCNHGYYQSSGPVGGVRTCLETGLWSGTQPVCSLCTDIPNCADIRCSNVSDHTCFQCESHHGPGRGERGYENLVTQCLPLCSWLVSFCYPGVCPSEPSSCNCSEGFEGPDCLNITTPPDLLSCITTLRGSDGRELPTSCTTNDSTPLYTNIVPHELEADWTTVFLGPSSPPTMPAYVTGFDVGVATSEIQAIVYRAANPSQPVTMTTHPCQGPSFSPDMPSTTLTMCSALATSTDLSTHTFLHGDTFEVQTYVLNGGYLDILDLDTNETTQHYYTGTPFVTMATFVIDLEAPTHCSLVSSVNCLTNQNILSLGVEITESRTITAMWGGWVDVPSAIVSYTIDIFELELVADILQERSARVDFMVFLHMDQDRYQFVVPLPHDGPYSFVLQALDTAGNIRYARRLVLVDETSTLEIDPAAPLEIVSAVPETGFMWQNSTTDPLIVSGRGHFYNSNLRTTNYLAAVANYTEEIGPEFDHPLDSGRYPRSGIPNALGVTRLFYEVIVDQVGGTSEESTTRPVVFSFETSDLEIEGVEISTEVEDGDSVRVWFNAIDFKFQERFDSVLVHVDSSPPVLQNLGLEYNGDTGLALHGTETLLDLNIQFQTYDVHSGIAEVEWRIGTEPGSFDVGYGNVPVQSINRTSCIPPDCICDPLSHCSLLQYSFSPLPSDFPSSSSALHDTDYHITITVTNYALLTSSLSHQITIDVTPPLPGAVFDATLGSSDVDYQQGFLLNAWWTGFFDRETDVAFYQYVFDTHCANQSYFTYPLEPGSGVVQTVEVFASWVAPEAGSYYVTVVAYNHVLRPSVPVCSDGVTVDTISPVFEGVSIPDAVVEPGLAQDTSGGVWLIASNRERWRVGGEDGQCVNRSAIVEDLSQYPVRMDGSIPATFDPFLCPEYGPFNPSSVTYVIRDYVLNISWYASDNVGIRDFQIGIANAENFTQDPSSVLYYQTAGQLHYSIHDPAVLSHGKSFFISLVVTDLALYETVLNIGPVVVDITPPLVNGSLAVERRGDHVTVTWDEGLFTDPEQEDPVMELEFAVGRTEFGTQIQPFEPLPLATPPVCSTPYCVAIDTTTTPLLSGHQYYFTVKARNSANLASTVTSSAYVHVSGAPSVGTVSDIDPSLPLDLVTTGLSLHGEDIDLLVDQPLLAAFWRGFEHAHLDVSYFVGLGTEPGLDDIANFTAVGTQTRYTFTEVELSHGSRYYVTVLAENEYGSTSASSDGVLVLQGVEQAVVQYATVYDGGEESDIDYQYQTSLAVARWAFPSTVAPYISHYQWAVFREAGGGDLLEVKPFENVGDRTLVAATGLALREGELYVSAVQACHFTSCLPAVYSDGFRITSSPEPTYVNASYTPFQLDPVCGASSAGLLEISWESFSDPQIAYYEWALGTGDPGHELLIYWNRVEASENSVSVTANTTISVHTPNRVALRGYNSAGLHSIVSTSLNWVIGGELIAQASVPVPRLVVFDISESQVPELQTTDWRELEYRESDLTDLEYTNSQTSLSAAWPELRYTKYDYSVSMVQAYQPCSSPQALACGSTISNAVTVADLELADSGRYYVCVQAVRGDAIHPTSSTPAVLTACSNGITVDLRPPQGSCVQIVPPALEEEVEIGSGGEPSGFVLIFDFTRECTTNGSQFQASTSDIHILWKQFLDVEQSGNAVHATGVAYYEYAIGTSPGANDVVDFTSVGVATEVVATGMTLQSGHTYYATIRAYDFTSQWSDISSPGVTVDTTPPNINNVWLEGITDYYSGLVLRWQLPRERESKLLDRIPVVWALGSRPHSNDLVEWTEAREDEISGTTVEGTNLTDGQLVFLSIRAGNEAGLVMTSTSAGYRLDSSPPVGGSVYDGPQSLGSGDILDLDYTSSLTTLDAHWRGFSDPHSGIEEYYWAIGTCEGCTDVQGFHTVGVANAASRTGLSLSHRQRYFITVRGCNSVRLCTDASSNGITVDTTPPIPGRVWDGYSGEDTQFQASRSFVSAHWSGFHDAESSLQNFVFYVGLRPNDSSIIPPTSLPPSETSFLLRVPSPLPINRTVFTTIVAYNRAGMYTQVSSDGVYIDDTPPETAGRVNIDAGWAGSVAMATQYSGSAIRVEWDFSDVLTPINQHFWTLVPNDNTSHTLPAKLAGTQTYATSTGLSLNDGNSYYAIVTGCNAAGLCTQSTSSSILVDSSPPIDGYFAVETDSTFDLNRAVSWGMTWRNRRVAGFAQINLAFVGFSDPHSGISEYWATVGTNFNTSDLTSGAVQLEPYIASENGTLVALVELEPGRFLELSEAIYISLWAENGVSLKSFVVQASFRVDPIAGRENNGTLTLLRSSTCLIESCLGHCTCGARGQFCSIDSQSCVQLDLGSLSPSMQVNVYDVVPQLMEGGDVRVLYTAVSDQLVGRWEEVDSDIQWLEWTVGEKGLSPGVGLIGTADPLWRDPGTDSTAVFTVSPSLALQHGSTYVFHVRAWYNSTAYAIFTSEGVTVDIAGPEVYQGLRVREVDSGSQVDVDFISSSSQVSLSWSGVFVRVLSGNQSRYEVGIGDSPGADNAYPFTPVPSDATSTHLSDLFLGEGRRYYSVVRAVSPLGVTTTSISDGFVVDTSAPNVGSVVDGLRYSDLQGQTDMSVYSARWFGFSDPQSSLHHYELAITDSLVPPPELEYENVGIGLKTTVSGLSLTMGEMYYAHVVAVNLAGLRSEDAVSSGVRVTDRRPVGVACTSYSEILQNPSFEGLAASDVTCDTLIDLATATESWDLATSYATVLASSTTFLPFSGCFSLYFAGSISQTISTDVGTSYKLSFALKRYIFDGSDSTALFQAKLTAPGMERFATLPLQGSGCVSDTWKRFEFVFVGEAVESEITLETVGDAYGVVVDGFSVRECRAPAVRDSLDTVVPWPDVIHLGQESISRSRTRLYANWDIEDSESGVMEYQWAIGTVPGGEQLQRYTSTGNANYGASKELSLTHHQPVFVSVLAWNFAGLERVVYSESYVVDLTPPVVGGVLDGLVVDVDYWNLTVIVADWSTISDPESGIAECRWAVGTAPEAADVYSYTIASGLNGTSPDLSGILLHGTTVYSTVVCTNQAGLHTTVYSDGVTILTEPPSSINAFAYVASPVLTAYDSQNGYIPTDSLSFMWGGFVESAGTPLLYEIRVTEDGVPQEWESVEYARMLTLHDLQLAENAVHRVEVRAVNLAGIFSDSVAREFVILTTAPVDTGIAINATWSSGNTLQLQWTGRFSSPAPIYYEFSLGTQMGSGSIRSWIELGTDQTVVSVTDARLSQEIDYFLALTAISSSGLHTTVNPFISGMP